MHWTEERRVVSGSGIARRGGGWHGARSPRPWLTPSIARPAPLRLIRLFPRPSNRPINCTSLEKGSPLTIHPIEPGIPHCPTLLRHSPLLSYLLLLLLLLLALTLPFSVLHSCSEHIRRRRFTRRPRTHRPPTHTHALAPSRTHALSRTDGLLSSFSSLSSFRASPCHFSYTPARTPKKTRPTTLLAHCISPSVH